LAAQLAERACIAFRRTDNMEHRVLIGCVVVYYFGMAGPVARCREIFDEIKGTIKADELSPLTLMQWSMLEIFHSHATFRISDYEARCAKADSVMALVRSTGMQVMHATIAGQCIYLALKAGDFAARAALPRQHSGRTQCAAAARLGAFHVAQIRPLRCSAETEGGS